MNTKALPRFPKRRRKRKTAPKDVRCSVRLIMGGVTRKTVKRMLTMAQALRELGGDPVCNEGRLMTGVPLNVSRRLVKGVRVVLMYTADHRPTPEVMAGEVLELGDMRATREVIRAAIPM